MLSISQLAVAGDMHSLYGHKHSLAPCLLSGLYAGGGFGASVYYVFAFL